MEKFSFETYCWSLGTTSFRMSHFNKKVEEQLKLLNDFWADCDNDGLKWNKQTQLKYYDYIFEHGLVTGDLDNPENKQKTARQKTSGLVDIGLINKERRLTEVGKTLLNISEAGDFSSNNDFRIPSDSYLYLKQLLKTSCKTQNGYVRPFLVVGRVMQQCDDYLTDEEFKYLLPLCVDKSTTEEIINKIHLLRCGRANITDIIMNIVLSRHNYPKAEEYFVASPKIPETFMVSGMNRDGGKHDAVYAPFYEALLKVSLENDELYISELKKRTNNLSDKISAKWKKLMFKNSRKQVEGIGDLDLSVFDTAADEEEFAHRFFKYMHLFKVLSNLDDYKDLNRRYLNITDAFIFADGEVRFTPIFESFFKTEAQYCFDESFTDCKELMRDIPLQQIDSHLVFNDNDVISVFNNCNHTKYKSLDEIFIHLDNERYKKFRKLIDDRFTNKKILEVLESLETRSKDDELKEDFGGDAEVFTILEYVVGIAWYRLSGYQGRILDYMKLQLKNDLLPKTHAGGGESDIVYFYEATEDYPQHTLLIECTLMESTTQRRGEMEPVSRHLSNYMIDHDENTYCAFVANNLHPSVISDFRGRKNTPFYRNEYEHVDSMKIIPLHTRELRSLIEKNIGYKSIYRLFDKAFQDTEVTAPPEWYRICVKEEIDSM